MERNRIRKFYSNPQLERILEKYHQGRKFFHQGYFPPGTDLTTRDIRNLEGAQIDYLVELSKLLDLKKDDYVLEIGCGTGHTAAWLAKSFGCRVLALDLVEENITKARSLIQEAGLEGQVETRTGDATEATFGDHTFTHVLSVEAVYYIQPKKVLFERISRWLKPGGRLVLAEYFLKDPCPALSRVLARALYGSRFTETLGGYRSLLPPPRWDLQDLVDVSEETLGAGFRLADRAGFPMVTEMVGARYGQWLSPLVPFLFRTLVLPRAFRGDFGLCFLRAFTAGSR